MSDLGNNTFTGIQDTDHDSKVMKGLVGVDILPITYRLIKAQLDATAGLPVANGYQLIDMSTGKQVHLAAGEQLLSLSAKGLSVASVGSAATFDIGLSVTQGAAVSEVLVTAVSQSDLNAGVAPFPDGASVYIVPSGDATVAAWLAVDVNVAALTGGIIQVVLSVV